MQPTGLEVSLPGDIQRYVLIAIAAVVAAVGLLLVAKGLGGGSSGAGGESAQAVLDKALRSAPQRAGRVAGTMTVNVAGPEAAAVGLAQPFKMSIDGVTSGKPGARGPEFDIGVQAEGGGERHAVHVISTRGRGYVELDGRSYELPRSQVRRFSSPRGSGEAAALQTLGVDPGKWITSVSDAGTASVGGEQTAHVIADVDGGRLFDDVLALGERTGQAGQIPAQVRTTMRQAVRNPKLEVYASKADGSLRRVVATAAFEVPGPQGKRMTAGARFDLHVSEVGRPQKIVAPRTALPFSRLDQSSLGLRGLSAGSAAAGPHAPADPQGGKATRSAAPRPGRRADKAAYLACVQQAADVPALTHCQQLLR